MSAGEVIFGGDHLRATLFRRDAKKLLVTFSFREKGRKDFDAASYSRSAETNGFSQLCIATRRNDWFINSDTQDLENAIEIISTGFDAVHMMGFSMGGYGAFRFARAARAQYVLTVSPQVSIHPDVVPFDRRFRSDADSFDRVHGDLTLQRHDSLQGVILADPFRPMDLVNAQMLREIFPRVALARLGFGGHPATALLRRAMKSGIVQNAALQSPPTAAPIIDAHRAARHDDADYFANAQARWDARRGGK